MCTRVCLLQASIFWGASLLGGSPKNEFATFKIGDWLAFLFDVFANEISDELGLYLMHAFV